jgi:hypothetical protein
MQGSIFEWDVAFCAGFLVPPCKGFSIDVALASIRGSSIRLEDSVLEYFLPLFQRSNDNSSVEVNFTSPDGEQSNPIRTLVRDAAFGSNERKEEVAKELALQLALATDERSDEGLFVIVVGQSPEESRVALYKFPADQSLQAVFQNEGLSINVVQGAFSRKTEYFKSAIFQGTRANTSFWIGVVEDKQANQRVYEVSDLWVLRFLQAIPSLNRERGTRVLAKALRTILNDHQHSEFQAGLVAAVITLRSQIDRRITIQDVAENYLPKELRHALLGSVEEKLLGVPFVLSGTTLERHLGVKTLTLDNGFLVSGPLDQFSDSNFFSERDFGVDGSIEIMVRGRIVRESLSGLRLRVG